SRSCPPCACAPLFFSCDGVHRDPHSFPTRRSSDLNLPRNLQVEFREEIQRITDEEGVELPSKRIHEHFMERYVEQSAARLKFVRSVEHTSELQSRENLVCRLLLEKKNIATILSITT